MEARLEISWEPRIFVCKGLKGRYFHDADFLTATRKRHASHTWRAILEGREVLRKGLIRRIGDGTTTNIWQHRWLPGHFGDRPLTLPDNPQVQVVADLLTLSGAWNENLIDHSSSGLMLMPPWVHRSGVLGMIHHSWAWEPERHGFGSLGLSQIIWWVRPARQWRTGISFWVEVLEKDLGFACSA